MLGPEKTQVEDEVPHCLRCIMVTADKQQSMGMSLLERRGEDGDGERNLEKKSETFLQTQELQLLHEGIHKRMRDLRGGEEVHVT